ncbi:hypothetical protein [Arabiibacter massiliensis]|uniref:hypothetical protein n=1 Tax=Arabiibacter massiliensis TaxID=1870985 RepID=UPI0009BBF583|nr:hypothetical protein [Arabiibacter massiliensis]
MQATKEIESILAKGQAKSGLNPLAFLDGVLDGNPLEAIVGGSGAADSTALYAKAGRLRSDTRIVPLACAPDQAVDVLRDLAGKLGKSLLALRQPPTDAPFIAYFNKGPMANPTVVVAEACPNGAQAQLVLTGFTVKAGLVQGHSLNAAFDKLTKLL